jgi:hypothetical protein
MALSVFKSGDALFDQGVDLIKRKEFAKARNNFEKSIGKGGKAAELAGVYIDIIDACLDNNNPARYSTLAATLRKINYNFEFGLTEVDPAKVAGECALLAERMNVGRMSGNSPQHLEEKGNRFLDVARKYQSQIGSNNILISEIVGIQVNTGIKESLYVQAWGYETLAAGVVMADPKKAAELLQNAFTCRKQLGEDGQRDMNLIKAYSKSVKCWICGRPSTGEGVHFVAMSSEISPFMRGSDDDILKSAPGNYDSIYVCKPCYSSISRRSDEISKQYYEQAMQEMRAMEARLQSQINNVYSMAMSR